MSESPATLAQLSELIYNQTEGWDDYWCIEDVVIARSGNTLVLRGSATLDDWLHDADCVPVWDSALGFVHRGFLAHMHDVFNTVKSVIGPGVNITGHSLGGARARILAALSIVNGIVPGYVVTFGSPKPAFVNLRRILEKSGCEHISFRNRNDIVPMLPMGLDYVHTDEWVEVDCAPAEDDFDALRDHSMTLYVEAVSKL